MTAQRGIIILARDNENFSYAEIASMSAAYARKHLSKFDEICLITDQITYDKKHKVIEGSFDRIIIDDVVTENNLRFFKDTANSTNTGQFLNTNRSNVYELSPYEETLVIDADYIIMSDVLDQVWGSENDFMINYKYHDISGRGNTNIQYLDDFTIPMCWATVFYFKKSEYTENLFFMINHIKNNYSYYHQLYNCTGSMFRNDYAFSIAIHIMNGGIQANTPSLPIEYLNNSFDLDDIFRVNSDNDIIMFCAKRENRHEHVLGRFTNMDLHIMNKFAISRNIDQFWEAVS
jgi:hypothetical protein